MNYAREAIYRTVFVSLVKYSGTASTKKPLSRCWRWVAWIVVKSSCETSPTEIKEYLLMLRRGGLAISPASHARVPKSIKTYIYHTSKKMTHKLLASTKRETLESIGRKNEHLIKIKHRLHPTAKLSDKYPTGFYSARWKNSETRKSIFSCEQASRNKQRIALLDLTTLCGAQCCHYLEAHRSSKLLLL